MTPARVLVCGGRDFDNGGRAFGALDAITKNLVVNVVIQGDCPTGADKLARMWAILNNHHLERYPADWTTYGKAAGPIRNQRMIDEGKPTHGVAFPGGRGTADMVRRLKVAGVPVREVVA